MDSRNLINVTKTYLPPFEEFASLLSETWNTRWVTNQGPLAEQLETKLKEYLGVRHLLFVSNGTIALQLAIRALGLTGEIITTPYSYVATATSVLWERCKPVFCDIDKSDFCMDVSKIEALIGPETSAILPTHVYGFPCDTSSITQIAEKHGLKVIYDAAHAFGVKTKERSLLSFGDVSAVSFHATKLFHTIEGGAVITDSDEIAEKLFLFRAFGHKDDDYISIGINARNSELHAAVGLCNLPRVGSFIQRRKDLNDLYRRSLDNSRIEIPAIPKHIDYNYSYFPVLLSNEAEAVSLKEHLSAGGINTRRYFHPSLNTLPYLNPSSCPVSENIAGRVLCLPMYQELEDEDVLRISRSVNEFMGY
ncbi:MAG: DegT/DnrJ/EryC1/StrS family aminotransferase [Ignavibacteria bacterium]|nr:DegT/DnrJ/EryC1/StrS family aminotransferase [Ignavibacteria bacterium]